MSSLISYPAFLTQPTVKVVSGRKTIHYLTGGKMFTTFRSQCLYVFDRFDSETVYRLLCHSIRGLYPVLRLCSMLCIKSLVLYKSDHKIFTCRCFEPVWPSGKALGW